MQLEQHVGIEVRIRLAYRDLELLDAPEGWRRDRVVGLDRTSHRGVACRRRVVGLGLGLLAKSLRRLASLRDQRRARLGVYQLIHLGEPLERVLAVEDARLVDLV